MLKVIVFFLAVLIAFLDYRAYKRLVCEKVGKVALNLFIGIVSFSYLLISGTPFLMFFFINEENNSTMMLLSMSILTLYLIMSICRLIIYIFWLPTKRKGYLYTGIIISSLALIFSLYSIFVTRTDYKINKIELTFDNLPLAFDNYRIVFISDIHIGSMFNAEEELTSVKEIISSLNADVVMFGGDLVNIYSSELSDGYLDILSSIKGQDKTIAVYGNHDTGVYSREVKDSIDYSEKLELKLRIESAGWVLLADSTVYLYRGNDSIAVTGIDYTQELVNHKHSLNAINDYPVSHIYENVPENCFGITLSHLPQLWYALCDGGYSDLTLSGHIHGMQFNVMGFSPAMFMYDEWSGLYERDGKKLYINDGIGSVGFIARIGARPEITVIDLKYQK